MDHKLWNRDYNIGENLDNLGHNKGHNYEKTLINWTWSYTFHSTKDSVKWMKIKPQTKNEIFAKFILQNTIIQNIKRTLKTQQ